MGAHLQSILQEAGQKLEERQYAEAEPLYMQAMRQSPGNAGAAMGLAMVYNHTGRPEQAVQLLDKLWDAVSTSRAKRAPVIKAAVLAQKGYSLELMGKFQEAVQTYSKAQSLSFSEELHKRIEHIKRFLQDPHIVTPIV